MDQTETVQSEAEKQHERQMESQREQRATMMVQMRHSALMMASQRAAPGATLEDIMEAARGLLAFVEGPEPL